MKNLKTTFFGCLTAFCTAVAASHHDPHGLAAWGVIAFGALTSYFTKDAHPKDDEDDDKWMRKPGDSAPAATDNGAAVPGDAVPNAVSGQSAVRVGEFQRFA